MARSFTAAAMPLDGLWSDILWLPVVIFVFGKRSGFPRLSTMSRADFVFETILLESAVRDIIARLTALDDDGRNQRSFQNAFAAMKREGLSGTPARILDRSVKNYRQLVHGLKVTHRNNYIAHVSDLVEVQPRIFDEARDFSTVAAVNLLDDMVGAQVSYRFWVGSQELEIDLRSELSADGWDR